MHIYPGAIHNIFFGSFFIPPSFGFKVRIFFTKQTAGRMRNAGKELFKNLKPFEATPATPCQKQCLMASDRRANFCGRPEEPDIQDDGPCQRKKAKSPFSLKE